MNAKEEATELEAAGCKYLTAKELEARYNYTAQEAKAVRKEMDYLEWLENNNRRI